MLQYQPKAKLQSQVKLYPLHWAYVKHTYSHAHVQTHKQNPWLLPAGSWCLAVTTCTEKPGPFGVPAAATALTPAQISCRSPGGNHRALPQICRSQPGSYTQEKLNYSLPRLCCKSLNPSTAF